MNLRDIGARVLLVGGDRGLVAYLQNIDLMVRNPTTLLEGSFRCTDIHSAV